MSCSKLKKNIEKPQVDVQESFTWKHIVVSDSKGRYLKSYVEQEIKWIHQSGASTDDIYRWLSRNINKLISEYQKVAIYIWTGTCDATFKENKCINVKRFDPLPSF